jgi:hypothetical protein
VSIYDKIRAYQSYDWLSAWLVYKANFNNISAISLREEILVLTKTPTRALEDVLL